MGRATVPLPRRQIRLPATARAERMRRRAVIAPAPAALRQCGGNNFPDRCQLRLGLDDRNDGWEMGWEHTSIRRYGRLCFAWYGAGWLQQPELYK